MATAGRGKRGSSSFEALVTVEPDHFCVFPKHTHTKQSNRHKVIAQFTAEELALIYLPFFLSQNKLLHTHLSLIVSWDKKKTAVILLSARPPSVQNFIPHSFCTAFFPLPHITHW